MTFKTAILNRPPLQEGNVADFLEINFDPEFPMADVSEIVLRIKTKGDKSAYLVKKLSENKITVTGQNVIFPLQPEDTTGHSGDYEYEIDFYNAANKPFATIKGKGIIEAEIK